MRWHRGYFWALASRYYRSTGASCNPGGEAAGPGCMRRCGSRSRGGGLGLIERWECHGGIWCAAQACWRPVTASWWAKRSGSCAGRRRWWLGRRFLGPAGFALPVSRLCWKNCQWNEVRLLSVYIHLLPLIAECSPLVLIIWTCSSRTLLIKHH